MRASQLMKIWSVYVMAAPHSTGLTYFKVGRSSDVGKRLAQVQTGCPLPISKVYVLTMWGNGQSQRIEARMHHAFAERRTQGEWFAFQTDDLEHKKLMNDAMRDASMSASAGGKPGKWRQFSVSELRAAVAAHAAEMAEERRIGRAKRVNKAMALMATTGRRIL